MTEAAAAQESAMPPRAVRLAEKTLKTIGENVRRRREAKKMSQRELAEKTGLSVSYVSMIERADRSPSMEAMASLALALGLKTVAELQAATGK
jgi:transcriptional regulator with XRE-family HTH domain